MKEGGEARSLYDTAAVDIVGIGRWVYISLRSADDQGGCVRGGRKDGEGR